MRKAAPTKNLYQTMIKEYESRREKLKIRYNKKVNIKNPEYAKAVRTINRKLTIWRRAIKRLEKRHKELHYIAKLVEEFLGYRILRTGIMNKKGKRIMNTSRKISLGRKLFYKFALEHGYSSPDVMYAVGSKADRYRRGWYSATNSRRKFNKLIQTSTEMKDLWRRFSLFMKDHYKPKN